MPRVNNSIPGSNLMLQFENTISKTTCTPFTAAAGRLKKYLGGPQSTTFIAIYQNFHNFV